MPVYHRRWFIKRIIEENERIKKATEGDQGTGSISENMKKLSQVEKMLGKKNS